MNRYAVVVVAVLSAVSLGAQAPQNPQSEIRTPRSDRVHKEAIVVDTHIDTTMMLGKGGWDFMVRHQPEPGENHVDLPRIREGGLDAAFFSISIVDHIDHAVKLAGAAHVGLGPDFDGTTSPTGWRARRSCRRSPRRCSRRAIRSRT